MPSKEEEIKEYEEDAELGVEELVWEEEGCKTSLEALVAEKARRDYGTLRYDTISRKYIQYNLPDRRGCWQYVDWSDVTLALRGLVMDDKRLREERSTTWEFWEKATKHLSHLVRVAAIPRRGFVYGDRFFAFESQVLEEPDPSFYCFQHIPNPSGVYETQLSWTTIDFLKNLCNSDPVQINLLRLFLKNRLLRNNKNECALFLVGVGLTGKSTFTKLLMKLFGDRAGVLELSRLSNRFEFSGLAGKDLLVVNDVNPRALTFDRCSDFKQLTSNESKVKEKKYEETSTDDFKGLTILTGNERFRMPQGLGLDSSGIGRRILYFPCRTVPLEIDTDLVNHLYSNVYAIVNWALGCELKDDMLIGHVQTLDMYLDGDQKDSMEDFISSCVSLAGWSREALGVKRDPSPDTLYGRYVKFCDENYYRPRVGQEFRMRFCASLSMLRVTHKPLRTKKGWFVEGISLVVGEKICLPSTGIVKELKESETGLNSGVMRPLDAF